MRSSFAALGLALAACDSPIDSLALPPLGLSQSMIVGTNTGDAVEGFALDAASGGVFRTKIEPGVRMDVEAWVYDRSLEELRLAPGRISDLEPAQRAPQPTKRLASAWTGDTWLPFTPQSGAPPSWFDRIRVPQLCAEISNIDPLEFETPAPLAVLSRLPRRDSVLVAFGNDTFRVDPGHDPPARLELVGASTSAGTLKDAFAYGDELYVAFTHGVYLASVESIELRVGELVADLDIDKLAVAEDLDGVYLVTASGLTGEVLVGRTGAAFQTAHTFPGHRDARVALAPSQDGTRIFAVHEYSNELVSVTPDHVARTTVGTSGLSAIADVAGLGVILGTTVGGLFRVVEPEVTAIADSPFGVLIGALLPFRTGFIAVGASGLLVEGSEATGFCRTHEIQAGVQRFIQPLGEHQWAIGASRLDLRSLARVTWE